MRDYEEASKNQGGDNDNGWGDLPQVEFNPVGTDNNTKEEQTQDAAAIGETAEAIKSGEKLREGQDEAVSEIKRQIEYSIKNDEGYFTQNHILCDTERMHNVLVGDWAVSEIESKYGPMLDGSGVSLDELFDVVSSYTPTSGELVMAHKNFQYAIERNIMGNVTPYEYFCGELPGMIKRNFSEEVPDEEKAQYASIIHKVSGQKEMENGAESLTEGEKQLLSKKYVEALDKTYYIGHISVEEAEERRERGERIVTYNTLIDSVLARLSTTDQEEYATIIETAKASQESQEQE